jgi:ribosomal protein S18 acetylase RimI-like enzyme
MRVALVPAAAGDYEFARDTYYATMRWIIERLFGWNQAEQDASFASQFRLEDARLIMMDDQRVGWIQTQQGDSAVTLHQFYVVPELQRRGIGTQVLRLMIQEARNQGKPLKVAVVKINPAKSFYDRFGFRITHEDEHKYYMILD